MRAIAVSLGALLALVPNVTAQLILGTEDLPELWGDDEVSYGSAAQAAGVDDHNYLAINRSWMEVTPDDADFRINLRVNDTTNLEENLNQWSPQCYLRGSLVADGQPTGYFVEWSFFWYNTPTFSGRANATMIYEDGDAGVGAGPATSGRALTTRFHVVHSVPGYYVWTILKAELRQFATNIVDLQAECYEYLTVGGFPTGARNSDSATSQSDFSLEQNRRVVAPDGRPDDFASLNRELGPASTSGSKQPIDDTPAPAFILVLLALAAATVGMSVRRRT